MMHEETWLGEGRDGAHWRRRKPRREKLMAGHGEFDDRGGRGREDVGVSQAAVGVLLEKKEKDVWWVGAASKGRRRKLG